MKCKVMGVINVTPDSFSDGGKFFKPEEALKRIFNMIDEGADIIDIGGESTRPGATPIGWEEEWRRIEPVVSQLAASRRCNVRDTVISVDTYHPETAEKALETGVGMINCVYAAPVVTMLELLRRFPYGKLVVPASFETADIEASVAERIYIDPMIGFGTSRSEDISLLRSIPELAKRGKVLVGVSRKRIISRLTGEKVIGKNLGGSLGMAVWCALNGASVVRVHDVRETVQALKAIAAVSQEPQVSVEVT